MTNLATVGTPGLKFKSALVLLAGALAVTAASAAGASPTQDDIPAVTIHYSTANLGTDGGAQALYHRLVRAAERVCVGQTLSGSPFPSEAEMKCRAQTLSGAIEKIHSPRLVAVSSATSKSG
jgi:UrcA family protein